MSVEKQILPYRAVVRASSINVPEWLLMILVIAPFLLLAMGFFAVAAITFDW